MVSFSLKKSMNSNALLDKMETRESIGICRSSNVVKVLNIYLENDEENCKIYQSEDGSSLSKNFLRPSIISMLKIISLQSLLKCDTYMTIAKHHDGNHTLTSVAMLGVSNVAAALIRARCIHTILVTSTIISSTFIVIYA